MVKDNNILNYILLESTAKPIKKGNKVLIDPCPICGHKGHFYIYPESNSYYSFSGCCKGGSLVDYLIEKHGMSLTQSMKQVHGNELQNGYQSQKELRELAEHLAAKVESFTNSCMQKYKAFRDIEKYFKESGTEYSDPAHRYVRQGLRFFDRYTDELIQADFKKQVKMMKDFHNQYFFKLTIIKVVDL